MGYLLENHHDPTYGFFFGLVAASLVVPWRLIKRLTIANIISCLLAATLVVGLTLAMSGEDKLQAAQKKALIKGGAALTETVIAPDPENMLMFFVAGTVAICAMILPGISGSFMLLLLGVYFDLLICINERQLLLLAIFAAGTVTGLLVFTRFLNHLLQKHGDTTMSFMLGLVFGSLFAIWPFKSFGMVAGRRVDIANIVPGAFTANEAMTLSAIVLGLVIVIAFMAIEKRQNRPARDGDTA